MVSLDVVELRLELFALIELAHKCGISPKETAIEFRRMLHTLDMAAKWDEPVLQASMH